MRYTPPIGGEPDDPYVDGNPLAGIEGSAVPAASIEDPQREIVDVIEALGGLTPDPEDLTQLRQAISAYVASQAVPFATAAETDAGVVSNKVVSPASLGVATKLLGAAAGYARLPGGLLMQWTVANNTQPSPQALNVNWPIVFPTAAFRAYASAFSDFETSQETAVWESWTAAGGVIWVPGAVSAQVANSWSCLVLGH